MFFDFSKRKKTYNNIAIIGAGTLGSALAYLIAKKRIAKNLSIFDSDKVEEKNTTNQIYSPKDVGKFKVEVLESMLSDYLNVYGNKSYITPYNVSVLDGYDMVIDTTDSLYLFTLLKKLTSKRFGFVKIRGTQAMFGFVEKEKFLKLYETFRSKKESYELAQQSVRFESSFVVCSLFLHTFAYNYAKNKIFFINLKEIDRIIEGIEL